MSIRTCDGDGAGDMIEVWTSRFDCGNTKRQIMFTKLEGIILAMLADAWCF